MSEKDNGGRAFPFAYETSHPEEHGINGGMTLRDYFAGQVLIATYMNGFAGPNDDQRAEICYRVADAMLKERAK